MISRPFLVTYMSQYTHTCIKCHTTYQDEDTEAYYCATCLEEHKALAAQLDANRTPSEQSPSELENLINAPGTIIKNGGNSIFFRESQL